MVKGAVQAEFCTNTGSLRSTNQDNLYFNGMVLDRNCVAESGAQQFQDFPMLFAVCDGMGGETRGDEAAYAAAKLLTDCHAALTDGVEKALEDYIAHANKEILKLGHAGSTLVALILEENSATLAHLGDSRAYLYRGGELMRLTEDHTQLRVIGEFEWEKNKCHVLTRHLGMDLPELVIRPSYRSLNLRSGDLILLCSDGLTDMVKDEEISAILENSPQPARALVSAALLNGGADNVTSAVVRVK